MKSVDDAHSFLDKLRALPVETEWLEFKEARSDFSLDKFGQYFSALANEARLAGREVGWMVFGIADRAGHPVVGTNYRNNDQELQRLKQDISHNLSPVMSFSEVLEVKHPDGRVLMFGIPAAPPGIPVAWNGHYYGRHGESIGALSLTELDRIRSLAGIPDWSAGPVESATMADIDARALHVARTRFTEKNPTLAADVTDWDDAHFLRKLRLMVNGRLTRAALLLLGRPESSALLSPAVVRITWLLKGETGDDLDYVHFGPPLLLASDSIFERVRNLTYRYLPPGTLFPTEVLQYDAWVMREALHNCIAHQDYGLGGRINLVEKPDELIFSNLGEFLPGSVEAVITTDIPPERYVNDRLTSAMVDLKMIDTRGGGIRRMFGEQRSRFFPLPEYEIDSVHKRVTVRIFGKLLDEKYTHALIARPELTLQEVLLLDRVQKKKPLLPEDIRHLRAHKLVEGRAPHFHISATVADMTGQQAAYIRNRGFNDEYYMDLILDLLRRFNQASRQQLDELLLDKLPERLSAAQRKRKVSYLLTKLRAAGRIHNFGSDTAPAWRLKPGS